MPQRIAGYEKDFRPSNYWREEVGKYQDLLAWSRSFRTQTREEMWRRSERQYAGKHWDAMDTRHDLLVVNMSFSTINTITPYVTGSTPFFRVSPFAGAANRRDAAAWTSWLNLIWNSYELAGDEASEVAVHDALLYGDGYLQCTWEVVAEEVGPDPLGEGEVTQRAKLFVDRVDPWDLWLDPAANGMFDSRWVIVRRTMPVALVKANAAYKNTKDLVPQSDWSERRQLLAAGEQDMTDDDYGLVDLYEFYDLVERRMVTMSEDSDMPHRVVEGALPPISQLGNYRIPNNPYHMGELEQLWDLQQELNKTRSQMITHRRRNVPKYIVAYDQLEEGSIEALQSEEPGEVIKVKGSVDPSTVVKPLDLAQLSADSYQVSDLITRDIYEISGVNEYLRGAVPQITRTATEASIIESASNIKAQYKLKIVERFLRRFGQIMLDVAFDVFPQTDFGEVEYILSGADAQKLAREQGEPNPQEVVESPMALEAEMFDGVYQVTVESHSTELRSPQVKAQRYQEVFMTFLQAAPQMQALGMPIPNLVKVARLWLESFGLDDVDSILDGSDVDPMAMQQMMMAQQGGGQLEPRAGVPNPNAAQAPVDAITQDNSGILPPQ